MLLFNGSVMSDSLWPHGLQNTRLLCPSPFSRVCLNSCPFVNWWCHPIISSSVVPFPSCLQSFPASGSFPMSWPFTSGGQSIKASASVFPINIQDWFPLAPQFKSINSLALSLLYGPTLIPIYCWKTTVSRLLEKPQLWLYGPFVSKVMSLLFNTLSRSVIAFLSRNKHLLIFFKFHYSRSPKALTWPTNLCPNSFQVHLNFRYYSLLLVPWYYSFLPPPVPMYTYFPSFWNALPIFAPNSFLLNL